MDFISFIEGFILGDLFIGIWFVAYLLGKPKYQEDEKPSKNPAVIIKKEPQTLEDILTQNENHTS